MGSGTSFAAPEDAPSHELHPAPDDRIVALPVRANAGSKKQPAVSAERESALKGYDPGWEDITRRPFPVRLKKPMIERALRNPT